MMSIYDDRGRRKSTKERIKEGNKMRRGDKDDSDHNVAKKEERRRGAKKERKREKMIQQFTELGLDENGNPLDNFSILKYPVRECKFTLPGSQEQVALNPVVTLLSVVFLWGMVMWSSVDPEGSFATLMAWRTSIAENFTWMIIGCKAAFLFLLMYTMFYYGHIHLGRMDEQPEYSRTTWFVMVFTAGAGPFFYTSGVAEPLMHQHSHFFTQAGYHSKDEIDMFALNMYLVSWCLLTWLIFVVVAVATSLAVNRFGLPLTFRSCFYPIFGAYTWGWIGDCIDALAIVLMILSACCMLCLGTIQTTTGLEHLGWVDEGSSDDKRLLIQRTTVWIITFISIVSVNSGLRGGMKYVSWIAFVLAILLGALVLFLDNTAFMLNLQVQALGYHIQHSVFQLNFWTDAFGQLHEGSGRAVDGKAAEQWWMSSWMVFYQCWSAGFASVYGVYVACLSKGRKLWELIAHCYLLPLAFCFAWACIMGGTGLRHARQAMELEALGSTYYNNSAHFLVDGSDFCYDVPQSDVVVGDSVVFTNRLVGVTPVCQVDIDRYDKAAFNVLSAFRFPNTFGGVGLGPMLIVLHLLGCALFHISMSDAASYIVDNFASNGRKNNHWARRLFWSSIVGAMGTTLLSKGDASALKAIESSIVVGAFPLVTLMCYLLQTITMFCRAADKGDPNNVDYEFPHQAEFGMPVFGGIFNAMEYLVSFGRVNTARVELGMDRPTHVQMIEFLKGLFIPFVSLSQTLTATYADNPRTNQLVVSCYALLHISWTMLFVGSFKYPDLSGLAMTLFAAAGILLALVRMGFRSVYSLRSNHVADVVASTLAWPQVCSQMRLYSLTAPNPSNKMAHEAFVAPNKAKTKKKRQNDSMWEDKEDDEEDRTKAAFDYSKAPKEERFEC